MDYRKYLLEIKWGLALGVAGFAWLIIGYLTGLHELRNAVNLAPFTKFFTLVLFAIILLGIYFKQKKTTAKFSYLDGLKTGLLILVIGIVTRTMMSPFYYNFMNQGFLYERAVFCLEQNKLAGISEEVATKTCNKRWDGKIQAIVDIQPIAIYGFAIVVLGAGVFKREEKKGKA